MNNATPPLPAELLAIRTQIDRLDEQLITLLGQRFALTNKVGEIKRDHHLPPADKSREQAQFMRLTKLATEHGVDVELAHDIFRRIIATVITRHERLRASGQGKRGVK